MKLSNWNRKLINLKIVKKYSYDKRIRCETKAKIESEKVYEQEPNIHYNFLGIPCKIYKSCDSLEFICV